ncbi:MAG: response regulator [Eubacterium sp.]|nr:response regulator [Eubacterium sp.]
MIRKRTKTSAIVLVLIVLASMLVTLQPVSAEQQRTNSENKMGGGYAATGQLPGIGYTSVLYDASNGLPTSDANYVMCSDDGFIWIGGYSGIIRYDGKTFERLDTSDGLTSGRAIFEDSEGKIWIGTNDNGVVLIENGKRSHITYKDGLPSSSIRSFAEDGRGTIYIGSTAGVSFIDGRGRLQTIEDERIASERIVMMKADVTGNVYGLTRDGSVFQLENGEIVKIYNGEQLGTGTITAMSTDPEKPGVLYIGTDDGTVFRGRLGKKASDMTRMKASGLDSVYWMCYTCGRLWVSSITSIGYFDLTGGFTLVKDIPVTGGIEMITSDYQGNIWLASTAQGVMKIVANNFTDLTGNAGIDTGVVNSTCLFKDSLYIGTDQGIYVMKGAAKEEENELTEYIGDARVRSIAADPDGDLLVCTYTHDLGLVKLSRKGGISSITTDDGLPSNEVRCTANAKDGSVLVGTNAGLAVIKKDKVVKSPETDPSVPDTVVLTVCGGDDGEIYLGTDGDGIYVINDGKTEHIGRDEGLTSDVILRIKWDKNNRTYWIITSNSIQYIKDGVISTVTSFPYNNNYDLVFNGMFDTWILSSYGVFSVKTADMLSDSVKDFELYTLANGLTTTPTSNSYSALSNAGNLYISGRSGVSLVNLNNVANESVHIKLGVREVTLGDEEIAPDANGVYTIPATSQRIRISPAILDYTLSNPMVRVYLEGSGDDGIKTYLSDLTDLEFTGLSYGSHMLHIQILDNTGEEILQDEMFNINKQPRIMEMPAVRILLVALIALIAGFIVWRILNKTVIRRQYLELQEARKEAESANNAKKLFLSNMSHEICTPIYTIMGMNELILREDARDVPKPYLKTITNFASDIKNASGSLLGLVNEILDLTNIKSGNMKLDEQEYDTAESLRSVVSMIRLRVMEKDLTLTLNIDKDIPSKLVGDAEKIRQILLNLLSNAVKYTEEGGITLSAFVQDKSGSRCTLRFSVKDTGIGIRKEDLDKIFTAYERMEEEENSVDIKGTGIGLDISRSYAELMDGKIWCESEYGHGSEFIFTVEQKIADSTGIGEFKEHDEDREESYIPQFVAPDAEILVVDDNPMNLSIVKGLLKATMVFVTTADSGADCLEKLKFGTFDLVLLDEVMPDMDGYETLARIREKYPDLPVYVMTTEIAEGEEVYTSKGFNGAISKPVQCGELESTIMKHISEEIMERRR